MARRQQTFKRPPAEPSDEAGGEKAEPVLDRHDTAVYIADVELGLRSLAKRADLPFLAYLLEMVVTEALERSQLRSQQNR